MSFFVQPLRFFLDQIYKLVNLYCVRDCTALVLLIELVRIIIAQSVCDCLYAHLTA